MNTNESSKASHLDPSRVSKDTALFLIADSLMLFAIAMTLHYRWSYLWIAIAMLIKALYSFLIGKKLITQINKERKTETSVGQISGILAKFIGILVLGYFLFHWQNPDIHKIGLIVIRIGAVISIIMAAVSIGKVPLPILLANVILPFLYLLSQRSWILKAMIIPREILPLIIMAFAVIAVIGAVIIMLMDNSAHKNRDHAI